MSRLVRILLKITGVFIALIIVLWLGVAAYVTLNKKTILQKLTLKINENISGQLTVKSMEPSLIQGFPGVAVLLKNVQLRDSLYAKHRHNLITAQQIYVAVNTFSLLSGKLDLQSITIKDGQIYLYTDSAGYRNSDLFKSGESKGKNSKGPSEKFHRVKLVNVRLVYDNQLKGKLFDFSIAAMQSKINYYPAKWNAELDLNTRVNSLTFKKEKGSFIKGKVLKTSLTIEYDHGEHALLIPKQTIQLDEDKLLLGGKFFFAPHSSAFVLQIRAAAIAYANVLTLLPPKIASKLSAYSVQQPLTADAEIIGKLKGHNIPLLKIDWTVKNSTVSFPGDVLHHCSFKGRFTNEITPGYGRKDPNSAINFRDLTGTWRGIPFSSDTLQVINLQDPVLQGRFVSQFPLEKINRISGSEVVKLNGGQARLSIWYKAPLNVHSKVQPYLRGALQISNGSLQYSPRNILFRNIQGKIEFKGTDVLMRDFRVKTRQSSLLMNGSIRNFANFYYTNPQKITIDWNIQSPRLALEEFVAFLGARKQVGNRYAKNKIGRFFMQLNRVLDEAGAHLELNAKRLVYKNFTAEDAHANIYLEQNALLLKDISLNHAGGKLAVSGRAEQNKLAVNKFHLVAKLDKVNVGQLFYAFDNFGQQSLTSKNIRGRFSALVNVDGKVNASGVIVPRSFAGKVKFNLEHGALIGFEPLEKVGRFAFPNRDFSNIRIMQLSNTLDVEGSKIHIPEMTVMTSVLNLLVEGVYGIPTGTQIALRIPLRNPEKDKDLADSLKEKRVRRGIVINLTAADDKNGVLKIKWGKKDKDDDEAPQEKPSEAIEDRTKKTKADSVKRSNRAIRK